MKKSLLVLLLILTAGIINAQSKFDLNGEIRLRSELNKKSFMPDVDPGTFSLLRTRVNAIFKPSDDLLGVIQIQDSRFFGEEPGTIGNLANLDLHQGYIQVKNFFDSKIDVIAGRFEYIVGNQRLIGSVGWSNIGRSFDGIAVKYQHDKYALDFFAFAEDENLDEGNNNDAYIYGAAGEFILSSSVDLIPILVLQKNNTANNLLRATAGAELKGKLDAFDYSFEGYYQFGSMESPDMDISAFLAAANFGYVILSENNVKIFGGIDFLSGDDDPIDDTYKSFNTLYATNHKFYGYMDYFINVPAETNNLGLLDFHAGVKFLINEKTELSGKYHYFGSHESISVANPSGTGFSDENSFGSEIDLTLKYNYSKHLLFTIGASAFIPSGVFEALNGDKTAFWGYLQTSLKL